MYKIIAPRQILHHFKTKKKSGALANASIEQSKQQTTSSWKRYKKGSNLPELNK